MNEVEIRLECAKLATAVGGPDVLALAQALYEFVCGTQCGQGAAVERQ